MDGKVQSLRVTRELFAEDPQGRRFADVANDPEQPLDAVLEFLSDPSRQRRMEESELHHDRPPLAGVVRELETQPEVNSFLSGVHVDRSKRLRQAVGVVVRMIMVSRGWKKTGRKGSLGVRAAKTDTPTPVHNTGGLAFWFLRGERYELEGGMPFRSVRERSEELESDQPQTASSGKQRKKAGRTKRARKAAKRD